MTRAAGVTQHEIDRAMRVVEKRGLPITGVELIPGGGVRILTTSQVVAPIDPVDKWRAERDGRLAA